MIGRSGERGSGISVLPVRYDDDDDDELSFVSESFVLRIVTRSYQCLQIIFIN